MDSSNEIVKGGELPVPKPLQAVIVSAPQSHDSMGSKAIQSDQVSYFTSNENLGAGGFGIVKKAKFRGQTVAIKSLQSVKLNGVTSQLKAMEMVKKIYIIL